MVDEEVMRDIELARQIINSEDCSIVVVNYGKIWHKKKGEGVQPLLETIEDLGEDIHGSVIGDRILGKASAMLCRYARATGVYAPQGTKTAIATLVVGGIPCEVDTMVPFVQNKFKNGMCPFETMLTDIDSPEEAYTLLKTKLL